MNVKEYIESGILEAYVLGALPQEERAEVAANIAKYPELAEEVAAIEVSMQHFAESVAKEPPVHMQEQIWNVISAEAVRPAPGVHKKMPLQAEGQVQVPSMTWQRAAIWIALIGSLLANFLLWNQRNQEHDHVLAMNSRLDTMQQQQQEMTALVSSYKKKSDMLADTGMQTIVMHSMQPGHPMAATVYWSKTNGAAYVSLDKLPMPPKGMQYQMWIIKDGKPVDMGMLPNDLVSSAGMDKLSHLITDSQAFAISLEKEGGSPAPTTVYVLGKVSS